MGCGTCKANAERAAASAAMCCVCRASRGIDPSECSHGLEGVQVALRVKGRDCPLGKFPNEAGIVRWLGADWYGVPMPVRLWLGLRHPKHPRPERWAGCGCLVRVKRYLWKLDPMAHL